MAATAVPLHPRRSTRRRPLLRVGDERLVARVRAGDDDAFEAIYDRYYLGLLAFCRHMLGSRDEAEDALQHSFASAYTALRGGKGIIDLRPWLYTIARNRCLSALRAQRDQVSADELELSPSGLDGLAGEIQLRADLRDLIDDLQRLPDDQRAALVLFELGDQSHEQIAEVLDVRREKVKALVFQAREALLRARRARAEPCTEVRERIATLSGDVPRRSLLRGHIDRCDGCAAFEHQVRRQRAAFAAILPVAPTVGLKASVLAVFGGGGAAAAGGAGATVAGSVAAGGTTVGLASLGAKGVVTKVLAVVALAGGTNEVRVSTEKAPSHRSPARQRATVPAAAVPAGAAAVRLRAPARRFVGSPVLRHFAARKQHSAAEHAPPLLPVSAAPAPAPVASHAAPPPAQTSAAAPEATQQAPAPAAATPVTSGADQQQAPDAPATSAATSTPAATPQATEAAAPTAAPAPAAPAAPTETAAPATTTATASTAAPQDAATVATAAAAAAQTTG
jgi:RNA polymerase sigma factor (sigma-70 family)